MLGWLRRIRARIRYRHFDRDIAREIDTHRALKTADHRARGLAPEAARYRAARDMGNVTRMREDARGVWIAPWLQSIWQDLRYAAASYRRQPMFAGSAIVILSLGTGLVTVAFSFAHATFLRPWQVPDPSSVVLLRTTAATRQTDFLGMSIPEYRHLRAHARSIDVFYTARSTAAELSDGPRALGLARTIYVSNNYFSSLQIGMRAGRGFAAAEDNYQSPVLVAVIGDRLWRDRFDRDPSVIGRVVRLGSRQITIVGVAAASSLRDSVNSIYDVALPLAAMAAVRAGDASAPFVDPRQASPVATIGGRLAAGVPAQTAAAELTTLSAQFRSAAGVPPVNVTTIDTRPISRRGGSDEWAVTRLVMVALSLVLCLACANVGNMLLARGLARRREIGVRLALGAGRSRLMRQLMTEASLLSIAAAAIGLALTATVPAILPRFVATEAFIGERPEFFAPTAAVYWFTLAIAVVTSMFCGLAPAFRATRLTVSSAMDRHGGSAGSVRLRRWLLSAQIAVATVLLTGAGLLTRATTHALEGDTGFDLNELQVLTFALPPTVGSLSLRQAFFSELDRSVTAAGIAAAFVNRPPIVDDRFSLMVRLPQDRERRAEPYRVLEASPSFFELSGVTLTAGRAPHHNAPEREVVASEAVARQLWPGGDPLGQTLLEGGRTDQLKPIVVVGVATDAALNSLGEIEPAFYEAPDYFRGVFLLRDRSEAAVGRVAALATAIEPGVVVSARPLHEYASDSLLLAVAGSWLAWGVGVLGLVLASVGAVGVFTYAVEERRREIGIRLALGARPSQIVRLVMRTSQAAALTGLAGGLVLSIAAAPLLRSYLYGLSPFDLQSYAQIAGILLVAAGVATWAPARRATRINPIETLRTD